MKKDIFDNYTEVEEEVKKIILFDEVKEAFEFYPLLGMVIKKKNYRDNNPEVYNIYINMITALKWVALPMLKSEKVLAMFKDNFNMVLKLEEYDLWEKVKAVLLSLPFIEDRDEFKGKLRNILNSNQTYLTLDKIRGVIRPTVENWIKDYVGILGNTPADKQKQADYFTNSEAIKKTSSVEKRKIMNFFKFYERLKISSGVIKGIEETIPVNNEEFSGIIKDGVLMKNNAEQKKYSKILQKTAREVLSQVLSSKLQVTNNKTQDTSNPPMPTAGRTGKESTFASLSLEATADKQATNNDEQATNETTGTTNIANENELTQLQNIANQYPAGSLERKAIEEEIKKITN